MHRSAFIQALLLSATMACLLPACEPTIADPYTPDSPRLPVTPTAPYFRADAGPDLTVYIPNTSVTLDGTASQDTGRTVTAYNWKLLTGSPVVIGNGSGLKLQVSGLHEGLYQFELKATGRSGATSFDTVKVTVVDEFAKGVTPVMSLTCDTLIRATTEVFHMLQASARVDSGGLSYELLDGFTFSQLSGPNTASLTPSSTWPYNYVQVKNTVAGQYVFKVEVDRRGLKTSGTITLQLLADTVKGKEYVFETIWAELVDTTYGGIVIHALIPDLGPLLLSSSGREAKVWISENNGSTWTEASQDWFSATLLWFPFICNDGVEVIRYDNKDKSAVGKKLRVKIQIVK